MARAILETNFYQSKAWLDCRDTYKASHPLCEICLAKGLYNPTEIIHHKRHLTEKNYKNPAISLNPANLQAVCKKCHNKIHKRQNAFSRFEVLPNGEIKVISDEELEAYYLEQTKEKNNL